MPKSFVVNASRIKLDFDRAQALMDQYLATLTADWVEENAVILNQSGVTDQQQAFFDSYCRRHLERYGEHFEPDLMANPF